MIFIIYNQERIRKEYGNNKLHIAAETFGKNADTRYLKN